MRIAVVGAGISGMVAAYLLHRDHEIIVFEAGDYVGGHTHTISLDDPSGPVDVDTGFIVYNEKTYPNFSALLKRLGVETQPSVMSFSVRDDAADIEYKGDNLNTLFAQRTNLLRPGHYRMLYEIIRFYRQSRALLSGRHNDLTVGDFVRRQGYSRDFVERHLVPMGAAIWSADPLQFDDFPAAYFVRFCHNHGMLNILRRPEWRVIKGGSHRYVDRLIEGYRDRIRLKTPVKSIRRFDTHVELTSELNGRERFDHVILATHSDQALRLLSDPSPAERNTLGAMRYHSNDVVLHTDTNCLPRRKRAWASWNYHVPAEPRKAATMTYNMNMLQSLSTEHTYCVSLNLNNRIDDRRTIRSLTYDHPVYTTQSVAAQENHGDISGVNRTHYCGAYWGYGFHEDGVNSALAVCRNFGEGL